MPLNPTQLNALKTNILALAAPGQPLAAPADHLIGRNRAKKPQQGNRNK